MLWQRMRKSTFSQPCHAEDRAKNEYFAKDGQDVHMLCACEEEDDGAPHTGSIFSRLRHILAMQQLSKYDNKSRQSRTFLCTGSLTATKRNPAKRPFRARTHGCAKQSSTDQLSSQIRAQTVRNLQSHEVPGQQARISKTAYYSTRQT